MTAAPSVARVLDPQGAEPATTTTEATSVEKPERRDWAFFFLLVFTVLVFLRPQDAIPGLHYLHLAELSAISALVSFDWGTSCAANLPVTRINPELIGVVALGGLILVTAPFSIWFSGAIGVFTEYTARSSLIYLLMTNVLTSPRRIERLTWAAGPPVRLSRLSRGVRFCARRTSSRKAAGASMEPSVGFRESERPRVEHGRASAVGLFLALREGSALRRGIAGSCAVLHVRRRHGVSLTRWSAGARRDGRSLRACSCCDGGRGWSSAWRSRWRSPRRWPRRAIGIASPVSPTSPRMTRAHARHDVRCFANRIRRFSRTH